jgi:hypothetical protein
MQQYKIHIHQLIADLEPREKNTYQTLSSMR